MIRILLVLSLIGAVVWWLLASVVTQPGQATITWGSLAFEMKTTTLVLGVLLTCMLSYLLLRGAFHLLGLPQRLAVRRQRKLLAKASGSLTQGLIQLAEGHWPEAEQQLTRYIEYSDNPVLNYLTAARAAHMQHQPERRDELLRKAIAHDSKAQIAVGVSQAEMQLSDAQLEQAHATLINLRKLAPQNSYVLKLYTKTLFRQQNWEQLLELLPELLEHDLLDNDSKNMRYIKVATLSGIFAKYIDRQQGDEIQALWQKIPPVLARQVQTKQLYASALHQAGSDQDCAAFIVAENGAGAAPDEQLTGLYGRLQHKNLVAATMQAARWLAAQPENPVNLLLLARLYRQQDEWETAKAYYVNSLNQAPDTEAYLELADMLEALGDYENATQCYRVGLRYSIRNKGERLVFAPERPPLQVAAQ